MLPSDKEHESVKLPLAILRFFVQFPGAFEPLFGSARRCWGPCKIGEHVVQEMVNGVFGGEGRGMFVEVRVEEEVTLGNGGANFKGC